MDEKFKILLVDDNLINLKVLSATLHDLDYKLLLAENGEKALRVARKALPDLILLDINIPGLTGFQVCEILMGDPQTKHIPVIFLSALDDSESKVEGLRIGAVDYITKPFSKEEVIVRVKLHIEKAKLTRELQAKNEQVEKANQKLKDALSQLKFYATQLNEIHTEMTDSVTYARRIQMATLPKESELKKYVSDAFIFFQPKDIVSGDFYFFLKKKHLLYLVVADCTGHGIPGAFLAMVGVHSLLYFMETSDSLITASNLLYELDAQINSLAYSEEEGQKFNDGMDVAIAVLDTEKSTVNFAGANRPLVHLRGTEIEVIDGNKFPIGNEDSYSHKTFEDHFLELEKGDRLFMFSDGFQDQFGGEDNKKFMRRKLHNLFINTHDRRMRAQKDIIRNVFESWKGMTEQTDDVVIVGVEF